MKPQLLCVLLLCPLLVACAPPPLSTQTDNQAAVMAEQATDDAISPWLIQAQALVRHQIEDPLIETPDIRFDRAPAPEPDEAPNALESRGVSQEEAAINMIESKLDGLAEALEALQRQPVKASIDDDVIDRLQRIEDKMLTAEQHRKILIEELDNFAARVTVSYKTPEGEAKESTVMVDETGRGVASLPPGAVVTAMGGIPIEQWRVENPGAIVLDGSVSTSVSGPLPITESPIVAPTEYYHSPDQFTTAVAQYPDSTQVDLQVNQDYMPSQCYTDEYGNQVCPDQPAAPSRTGGVFSRLRGRGLFGRR